MGANGYRGPGWFEFWWNTQWNTPPEKVKVARHSNFKDVVVATVSAPKSFKNRCKPSPVEKKDK